MTAYYNEHDPFAAQWLRNLIAAGHIAPGDVDTRSIEDVHPDDLRGYDQCHFFAGIGIWSHALRHAGWEDTRGIWTGSCPCQPFSAAGKGGGVADERHLWPAFHHLIAQCRPDVVVGEQVASKDGLGWLDLVSTDMEATDYAGGAVDLCAAGFEGAHIRQRQYFVWVADADLHGRNKRWKRVTAPWYDGIERNCSDGRLANHHHQGLEGFAGHGSDRDQSRWIDPGPNRSTGHESAVGRLAYSERNECGQKRQDAARSGSGSGSGTEGLDQRPRDGCDECIGLAHASDDNRWPGECGEKTGIRSDVERWRGSAGCSDECIGLVNPSSLGRLARRNGNNGRDDRTESNANGCDEHRTNAPLLGRQAVDWLFCRDGKWRPVESGTFPLAHEDSGRVGRLRAYGNALDAETATGFIEAVMATIDADDLDPVDTDDLIG